MRLFCHIFLLVACVTYSQSSLYSHVKDNVLSLIQKSAGYDKGKQEELKNERSEDITGNAKASAVRSARYANDPRNDELEDQNKGKGVYTMDHVLNFLSRRSKNTKVEGQTTSGESSSSMELQDWKDEWREHWIQKKFEAINTSAPRGDDVNMVAARPWGVPCGDPNQHDMPWGSCMLPMECESEYRIYRGDYFCGRTAFVCCAIQITNYDMYQGFDVSFADSSLQTDSSEKRNRLIGSKERKKKKKQRMKRRRKRERLRRKRKIKRNIRKIIKEIRKILSRSYRNGTTNRKRKTKQLKRFVKHLKKQYKKDRKSVKSIHEFEIEQIDHALQRKIDQLKGVNQNFIRNQTFRDIVVNGSITPPVLRMLVQAYPELATLLDSRRRSEDRPDYLEYDIEYGLLYY